MTKTIEGLRIILAKKLKKYRVPLLSKEIDDVIVSYQQKIERGVVPPDKNTKIYLAHPYDRKDMKRKQMLIKKLEERGFEVVDPFIGEDTIAKEKYGVDNYYENPTRDFAIEIKTRDFEMLDKCGAFFVWIPKGVTMIGAIREYDRAIRSGKYIIVLCYKANPFLEDADELYLSYGDFVEQKSFRWT